MLIDNFLPTPGHEYRGGITNEFEAHGHDVNWKLLRRPFINNKGQAAAIVNMGEYTVDKGERKLVFREHKLWDLVWKHGIDLPLSANATSLKKEEWIQLDRVALGPVRKRLKAYADLRAASTYGGFNAMAKSTLEYQVMSDAGDAVVDMDLLSDGTADRQLFRLRSIPLPFTHSDFWFGRRELNQSRGSGGGFDTSMAEAAGRRVGETIEKTTIGISGGFSGFAYGGVTSGPTAHDTSGGMGASSVYGYTTYPHRNTKDDFTAPTAGGWVPSTLVDEVLDAIETLRGDNFFGPYMIYNSTDWDKYLDKDYYHENTSGAVAPTKTLRTRIKEIAEVADIRRLDFLTSTFTLLIVQMGGEYAPRAINGMEVTTIQWESQGGLRHNFKVAAVQVPQMRSDYDGKCGILEGTTQ